MLSKFQKSQSTQESRSLGANSSQTAEPRENITDPSLLGTEVMQGSLRLDSSFRFIDIKTLCLESRPAPSRKAHNGEKAGPTRTAFSCTKTDHRKI